MYSRCLRILGIAVICSLILWVAGRALVRAIYYGQTLAVLDALITGQATHAVEVYLADFNRLFLAFTVVIMVPLLVCSLLPQAARAALQTLPARVWDSLFGPAQFRLPLRRRPATAVLAIALICIIAALYHSGQSTMTRIPASYTIGGALLLSGPSDCEGSWCYELEVSCPQLGESENVSLLVDTPDSDSPERGTILFFSGWVGNFWWEKYSAGHRRIVEDLQSAGFRIVQVRWHRGWMIAAEGSRENPPLLACRPATLVRWVFDNLHEGGRYHGFCAVGHSNGASEIAYMLSRYNLDDLFSMVVMEAGPNLARIDHSCIHHPAFPQLQDDLGGRSTIDWAYGYPNDGQGPCARQDGAYTHMFRHTGIFDGSNGTYSYPGARIAMIFGDSDESATARHAEYYRERLAGAGASSVTSVTVAGAGHLPSLLPAGADALLDALLNGCHGGD